MRKGAPVKYMGHADLGPGRTSVEALVCQAPSQATNFPHSLDAERPGWSPLGGFDDGLELAITKSTVLGWPCATDSDGFATAKGNIFTPRG
jgi:hypothetical protein